jgi:hypothetical protein
LKFYLKEVFEPETLLMSVKNEGLVSALINYSIIPAIFGIIFGFIALIVSLFTGDIVSGIIALIIIPIVLVIAVSIIALIVNAIIYIGAKLVGTKTGFVEQTYKLSVVLLPMTIITIVLGIIGMLSGILSLFLIGIPLLMAVMAFSIALSMFSSYLIWTTLKTIHSMDNTKLIKAITVSSIIFVIIMVIIIAISAAIVMATVASFLPAM